MIRIKKRRANGEGSVVKCSSGYKAIITIGWKDKTHPIRHTRSGFRTAREAREYIYSYSRNEVVARSRTLGYYWDVYCSAGLLALSQSKQTHFHTVWRRLEHLRSCEVVGLEVAKVQEVVNQYSYYPARDIKTLVSHLFKLAIADNEVERNLAESLVLPPLKEEPTVPFTVDEVHRIWADYQTHPLDGVALLMIYTGMMPAEVVAVRSSDINWDEQIITGVGVKTKRRRDGFIVVPDKVVEVLRRLLDEGRAGGLLPCSVDVWRREFREMVQRIGASPACVPYSCRVTFATVISHEVTPATLAQVMRNSIAVTDRFYILSETKRLRDEVNSAVTVLNSYATAENSRESSGTG